MRKFFSRRRVALAAGVLLLGILSFAVWRHHVTGARFVVRAVPITKKEAFRQCVQEIQPSEGQASSSCSKPEAAQWFRLDIRSVGGRGAWIRSCFLEPRSGGEESSSEGVGAVVALYPRRGIPVPPYIPAGGAVTLYWYAEGAASPAAAGPLPATCSTVVYKVVPV
jgi:hypothetical protein